MEDEELRQRLQVRLDHWRARMSACDWSVNLQLAPGTEPRLWAALTPDDGAQSATLKVPRNIPEEAVDWVFVHSLSRLLIRPLERFALETAGGLPPEDQDMARHRLGFVVERAVQRIVDALIPKEDAPFLVQAMFAMSLYEP